MVCTVVGTACLGVALVREHDDLKRQAVAPAPRGAETPTSTFLQGEMDGLGVQTQAFWSEGALGLGIGPRFRRNDGLGVGKWEMSTEHNLERIFLKSIPHLSLIDAFLKRRHSLAYQPESPTNKR